MKKLVESDLNFSILTEGYDGLVDGAVQLKSYKEWLDIN